MTPMIDIVFLLIIFFITVSQFTQDADRQLPLPTVNQGALKPIATTFTINIDRQGDLFLSGRRTSLDRVVQLLQNKLAAAGGDPRLVQIELRCDKRCPNQFVDRLVRRLSEIGFRQIRVAVADR
jgi:biopolymer transport protein ExbD